MRRRHPWLYVLLGLVGILGVLVAAGAAYWQYANFVPDYPRLRVAMPVPNAYDDYVRAGQMAAATGGASVLPATSGNTLGLPPMPSDPAAPPSAASSAALPGMSREAYEEGVPLPQVRAVVARNRAALARLRQGFRKTYRTPAATSATPTFPEMASYRTLARVLITEGKLAEREGRMADAARSYLDCLHLGLDTPRGGVVIHGLVGIAVEAIGLNAMSKAVDRMDGPTALATAREMHRLDQQAPGAAEVLQGEKEYGTQSMLQMFREGVDWKSFRQMAGTSGPVTASDIAQTFRFLFTPKKRMMDDYRAHMDALIADFRGLYYAVSKLPPLPNDPLSQIMLPVFAPMKWRWAQRDVCWRITELRLAARAYQSRYGVPPPSAETLVPTYLPAVPRDPCADKPLVYRVTDGHAVVYSRGPDGDDDGGLDLGSQARPGMNGDVASFGRRNR